MKQPKLRHLPLVAAVLATCTSAIAGYQSPDGSFSLSGFGTLGASRINTDDVQFNYPGQGGGSDTSWGFSPDSKIAVQGTYKFTPQVSATAQVMTKLGPEAQYLSNFDWAFAKWQASPALTFRAGRMGGPFFMISDFRNVGYANTAVRPNLDVYGQVPTDRYDGIDATYQHNFDSMTLNATVLYGDAKADFTPAFRKGALELGPSGFELKGLKGINLTLETDTGFSYRLGYLWSKYNLTSDSIDAMQGAANCLKGVEVGKANTCLGALDRNNALLQTLSQSESIPFQSNWNTLGVNFGNAVNNSAVTKNKDISFLGFGVTYDMDNWVVTSEYTKRRSNSFVTDTTGWYANVGYRVGKFTPYIAVSKVKTDQINVKQDLVSDAILGSVATNLNKSLKSFLDVQKLAQNTVTVGSRWDVAPGVALKGQFDRVTKPADSWGMFFAPDPSVESAQSFLNTQRKVNVLSLSVDVVF